MSSYGDRLVGDKMFKSTWETLDKYSALVFLHPSHLNISPEKIGGFLPQPVVDYPQATTRAAMSLIYSGIMTECNNVEVILSHAGGAFPFLAHRGISALAYPTVASLTKVNAPQAFVSQLIQSYEIESWLNVI
jgi:6-methylsalicylate decarboxylase